MIRELVRREARAQLPFFFFLVALEALNLWFGLLAKQPDLESAREILAAVTPSGAALDTILTFVLCFGLGSGLLVRELDDRTIEFLDGLPVSRSAIFAVKVLVGAGLVAVFPLCDAALAAVQTVLARTSLIEAQSSASTGQVGAFGLLGLLGLIGRALLLEEVQAMVFLALGLLLGYLRRFAWVAFGILYWLFVAVQRHAPALAALNPFVLTRPTFAGRTLVIPWLALAFQVPLAGLMMTGAWLGFLASGSGRLRAPARARRWGLLGASALAIATCALVASILFAELGDLKTAQPGTVTYPTEKPVEARTRHYTMVYPDGLRTRALALIARADATHERVAAFFAGTSTFTIAIDASGAAEGTAGNTVGKKIRLALAVSADPDRLAAILGHETVHSFASVIAGGVVDRELATWRLFDEGLAAYVEYREFHPADLAELEIAAGALAARRQVRVEYLADFDRLARGLDPDAVYPLGVALISALVARYGPEAPARILRAAGRPGVRDDLRSEALLRDAFQAAGFDFDAAVGAFLETLDRWSRLHAAAIAAIPRLSGAVEADGAAIEVRADRPIPDGARVVCRFRSADGDAAHREFIRGAVRGGACSAEDALVAPYWFQLGIVPRGGSQVAIWEPWVQVLP